MTEPILSTRYWKKRIQQAPEENFHHSIFKCDLAKWNEIEVKHRNLLSKYIHPNHSVLDVGCGYGRLLTLMPQLWIQFKGTEDKYIGIDISPDFISLARKNHPDYKFYPSNILDIEDRIYVSDNGKRFDWAICVSFRPMIERNLGSESWEKIEAHLKNHAERILLLEYDVNDNGTIL